MLACEGDYRYAMLCYGTNENNNKDSKFLGGLDASVD